MSFRQVVELNGSLMLIIYYFFTFLHFLIATRRMGYRFRDVEGVVFRLQMKLVATHSLDGLVADIMPSIDASVSLRFSMEACCNSFFK